MNKLSTISSLIIALIVLILLCFDAVFKYSTVDYQNVCVDSKERVITQDSSKYLIFTDKGVFENTDSLLFFKYNSSDLYAKLRNGSCYDIKRTGWRITFFSVYPNIIKVVD